MSNKSLALVKFCSWPNFRTSIKFRGLRNCEATVENKNFYEHVWNTRGKKTLMPFSRLVSPSLCPVNWLENSKRRNNFVSPKNAQDLLLIRKFVRRMKGVKYKTGNGQMFEKAANLWLLFLRKNTPSHFISILWSLKLLMPFFSKGC